MIIFIDVPSALSLLLKALAGVIIILISFKLYRVKSFFTLYCVFMFSNFLFLGIIIGLYMLFNSRLIVINNSTVYFNISARALLLCSLFAYICASIVIRLYNRHLSKGELYMLEIINDNKSVNVFALSDTGNRLREPFSSNSVIVVKSESVEEIFNGSNFRLIPASTVSSSTYLKAYKPDRVIIKNAKGEEVIENVYIALSDSINSESYSAIINPEVLSV